MNECYVIKSSGMKSSGISMDKTVAQTVIDPEEYSELINLIVLMRTVNEIVRYK